MRCPGLPSRGLLVLAFGLWASVLQVQLLFPFVGLMVVDFGMAPSRDQAGYWAGLLAGAFMLGRTAASTPWGFAADRWGRVRVIRLASLLSGLLTMGLGLCQSYWAAVAIRVLTGACNPIMAVSKALVPALVPPERQPQAMSLISIQWQLGLLTGPILGGMLAGVCCGDFPYLLPCLICGGIQLGALIPLSCCLAEPTDQPEEPQPEPAAELAAEPWVELREAPGGWVHVQEDEAESEWIELADRPDSTPGSPGSDPPLAAPSDRAEPGLAPELEPECSDEPEEGEWSWLAGNYELGIMLAVYCSISLVSITTDEVLSLWALSSQKAGGLAVGPGFIGLVLAGTGLVSMLFQLSLGPALMLRWKYRRSMRYGCCCASVAVAAVPFTNLLGAATGSGQRVNGRQAALGRANGAARLHSGDLTWGAGLGMTLSSICKAAGPMLLSPLFAWSLDPARVFPFDCHLYFLLVALFLFFTGVVLIPCIPAALEEGRVAADKTLIQPKRPP